MTIRDEEIKRLIHYAKGMGVKVTIYNKPNKGAAADWTLDGTSITVYAGKSVSKTSIVLSLIHELGHHLWFIHEKDRQPDLKFHEAIDRENIFLENKAIPTPKHLRKKILGVELAGTAYWDTVIKDVGIKIPKWKVEAAKEFDIWMYEMYYENGKFPQGKFKTDHYSEVRKKHENTEYA